VAEGAGDEQEGPGLPRLLSLGQQGFQVAYFSVLLPLFRYSPVPDPASDPDLALLVSDFEDAKIKYFLFKVFCLLGYLLSLGTFRSVLKDNKSLRSH
jgi:hypothetical protein